MNWFKRMSGKMAVCPVCHVYFDPRRHDIFVGDNRFREYCDTHRKEKIAKQNEKEDLARWLKDHKEEIAFFRANARRMKWFVENWPELEKQYLKESCDETFKFTAEKMWAKTTPFTPGTIVIHSSGGSGSSGGPGMSGRTAYWPLDDKEKKR